MSKIDILCKYDKLVKPQALADHPKNPNSHSDEQITRLAKLYEYTGIRHPIIVSGRSGFIVAGHGRKAAAIKAGLTEFPVVVQNFRDDEEEYAFLVADNAVADWSDLDLASINSEIGSLGPDFDLDMLGIKDFELEPADKYGSGGGGSPSLADRFLVPPFSVLDARQGYWQERKRQWLAMGIESELGRDLKITVASKEINRGGDAGGSIFDPVLCEIAYRWFCPPCGVVLDPFAGGSVRGIVANHLKLDYHGIELRKEQVDANRMQAKKICGKVKPMWHVGDSAKVLCDKGIPKADLIFSCPPYLDLEVYSDHHRDLSQMPRGQFFGVYRDIVCKAINKLKDDRFIVWVVGEVREKSKSGCYANFVGKTIETFESAGASYYNEAILVTSVGSLPIRAGRQFEAARKLGKTHQNVLVFVKGDPKKAAKACGNVAIPGELFKETAPELGDNVQI